MIDTSEVNLLTKEGKKKLEIELKQLVEVARPKAIEEIKTAREQGDLSENAEYDAAREQQGQIEDRIREIEAILNNAKTIASAPKSTKVSIGSVIEILTKDGKKAKYNIVGTLEADPFAEPIPRISNESPLARAILNKSKGDKATVLAEKKYEVTIVSIGK